MNDPSKRRSANQNALSPEDILTQALNQDSSLLNGATLRLLVNGYRALRDHHARSINETERFSIEGMIAYVAYAQNVTEDRVCAVLTTHFSVEKLEALPASRYNDIIEFLVDLEMIKVVN